MVVRFPDYGNGWITKLWFKVPVVSLAVGSDAMSWGLYFGFLNLARGSTVEFHHSSPGDRVPLFIC